MNYYIILERHLEYNDEYYSFEDAGIPTNVFLDKSEAERVCFQLNKEYLQGLYIWEYEDMFMSLEEELPEVLNGENIIKNLTDVQAKQILLFSGYSYPFYFISEIEQS